MIFIDELKDMKLYKKEFFLPRNKQDKLHGRVCTLLTPNIESTIKTLKHPLLNSKFYNSKNHHPYKNLRVHIYQYTLLKLNQILYMFLLFVSMYNL